VNCEDGKKDSKHELCLTSKASTIGVLSTVVSLQTSKEQKSTKALDLSMKEIWTKECTPGFYFNSKEECIIAKILLSTDIINSNTCNSYSLPLQIENREMVLCEALKLNLLWKCGSDVFIFSTKLCDDLATKSGS